MRLFDDTFFDALDAAPTEALPPMMRAMVRALEGGPSLDPLMATTEGVVQQAAVWFYHTGVGHEFNAKQLARFIELMEQVCPNPTEDCDGEPVKSCADLIAAKLRFELREGVVLPLFAPAFHAAVEIGVLRVEDLADYEP